MGELDLLKPTIERSLGGTIHFGRVAMKPGRPTTFATVPFKTNNGEEVKRTIFALPGNPGSALGALHIIVFPALRRMSGVSEAALPKLVVKLEHEVKPDSQVPGYRAAVVRQGLDGLLYADTPVSQRSSKIGILRKINAFLILPAGDSVLAKGEKVEALMVEKTLSFSTIQS